MGEMGSSGDRALVGGGGGGCGCGGGGFDTGAVVKPLPPALALALALAPAKDCFDAAVFGIDKRFGATARVVGDDGDVGDVGNVGDFIGDTCFGGDFDGEPCDMLSVGLAPSASVLADDVGDVLFKDAAGAGPSRSGVTF